MLAPTSPISHASVVLSDGCSVGPALCRRLKNSGGELEVRPSPVLGNWDGLTDVSAIYRKASSPEYPKEWEQTTKLYVRYNSHYSTAQYSSIV